MHSYPPVARSRWQSLALCLWLCFGTILLGPSTASAQNREPPTLRLDGVAPAGVRGSATTSWGRYDFDLANFTDTDRTARVLLFFKGHPDVQYGRDVWVPAHSSLRTWMLVGPAVVQPNGHCEIETLLYDRSDGKERLVLPRTEERVRERGELYRKREPTTSILLDNEFNSRFVPGTLPQPASAVVEAVNLVRIARQVRNQSPRISFVFPVDVPDSTEAFDGIDELVLATGRIANNQEGMLAIRQWLERGGKLWVMLDLVDPESLAPILGDALDFQLLDRVGLTRTRIDSQPIVTPPAEKPIPHDRPVQLARVLLPPQERLRQTVDGWPTWFTRSVGRGKVLFTTLGQRGWVKPGTATPAKLPEPQESQPLDSTELQPSPETITVRDEDAERLRLVLSELQPSPETIAIRDEDLRPLLSEEIGYSVVSRKTVALIFALALLTALAVGLALRRTRRPELLGWLGPVAAVGAALTFLFLGQQSRRALSPPTVSVVSSGWSMPFPAWEEVPVHGVLAVYQPDSGALEAGVAQGGLFELDAAGLEGQTRRLILTDLDSWHWDHLSLPAGLRFAPFHDTVPTGEPIAAVARCGPEGLEGQLTTGPFLDATDALLTTSWGRNLAIRLRADGKFSAGSQDILPTGQYLAGAVLSDQQQRRQELYRTALKPRADSGRGEAHNTIMVWTSPVDMHFTLAPGARSTGSALLIMPLRLERPAARERVTIPGPLVSYRRVVPSGLTRPHRDFNQAATMHLRFQIPPELLPLKVERARLVGKIDAPGRRVTVSGRVGNDLVELHKVESPLDPISLEIAEERLLALDPEGGLHLELDVSDMLGGDKDRQSEKWIAEYLELEIVARGL